MKAALVLFVEDDPDIRVLYGNALREAGLFVDEVVSVHEAVEVASRLRPDIVVLDRNLPDGDGWDVARDIKANASTKHIPIVGFTAHRTRGDMENALVAGCDMLLAKPCTPDSLVRHVRGMLAIPDVAPEEELLSLASGQGRGRPSG